METATGLTRRERVILAQLALPLTLSEIAASLFVTRNTVKSQVRSIYLKLDVADRESALAAGRARGLITEYLGGPEPRRQLVGVAAQTSRR
ncbi:LuxR C-terminal-related transcriptional regulator [uncultured Cellulomonas sp.]|uniref:LuxR C-terminal-related transcriptional regulator n=1 Tax=uncultured Cellulomonas sp. TaxID=189682 RepID=UPI0028EB6453|nr:LuxR C-terminal-related transcriptional regulator [uncultured Cellulomonas sp.]